MSAQVSARWHPSLAIQLSLGIHLAALLVCVLEPRGWIWAVAAVVANHGWLTVAGLLPRSSVLGPNITRLPRAAVTSRQVALTFDDGPDPQVTPAVLEVLDRAGVKATFFCIGWRARKHPELCKQIAARGHSVQNHGDAHSWAFSLFGYRKMRRDVEAAQATLTALAGRAPRFFRPTAGLRNPFLEPVLVHVGLRLACWTRRAYDTRTPDPATVLERLTRNLGAGDILLLHDGHGARTREGRPVVLEVLPPLLERLAAQKLHPVTLDQAIP